MRKLVVSSVAAASFVIAALATEAAARAATCTSPSIDAAPNVSFGTSIDVYATPSVIGPFTVTGDCAAQSGGAASLTFTITFGAGNNLTGGNRAMKCTTACTFTNDLFQYYLCSDAACATPIGSGGTLSASCSKPAGKNACSAEWSVTFYAEIVAPVAGGTNDSSIGQYTDAFTISVASP